jgi:hypothetical protein
MAFNGQLLEEFRRERSWVELIFKIDEDLKVGYINQRIPIRKILIFFKDKKPLYIFFGTPDYLGRTNLTTNKKSDASLFNLLEACVQNL